MTLVLYLGWPCALALVIGLAGLHLGRDALPHARRLSATSYGKYEALSICVQSVTGERAEDQAAREQIEDAVRGLTLAGPAQFTLPASVDAGCPTEAAHYGASSKVRRVADRGGSTRPAPSAYHLHVYVMPRTSLLMLRLEPALADRRVVIEEYVTRGTDGAASMIGVTYGLYATADELTDRRDVREFFSRALQMQSQLGARAHASP